ncbi:MAG: hypothetical protein JKY19_00710 [Alcanivoracaceae bacterium]|nr:hypothetical protein [Alcanivoracaceae bacterium]
MKTTALLTMCTLIIFITGCASSIKKDNKDLYAFTNAKWSQIETTDGKSYESFPPKLNVKLKGSDKWQYILEKNAKSLAQHIKGGQLRLFCEQNKPESTAKWKWHKNKLMIQCGNNSQWKKATIANIDYNSYWR